MSSKKDMVNSPPHYQTKTGLEAIHVIDAFELPYDLGNVVKYTLRSGKKGEQIQDLNKAIYYLRHAIERISKETA